MRLVPFALRRDPLDVLAALAREPGTFLLEVSDPVCPAVLLGCRPAAELRVGPGDVDPLGKIVRFVEDAPRAGADVPFPLGGGVIACLAYELGAATVPGIAMRDPGVPLAILRRYDTLLHFDRRAERWSVVTTRHRAHDAWLDRIDAPAPRWDGPLAAGDLRPAFERDAYGRAVARIHAYLDAGDVYQVNLTQPFTAPLAGPAWAVYARLARRRPAAYGVYLDAGDFQVVGNSPELWLRRRGRHVETRPIKGTNPRGASAAEDAALADALARDPKELAEHVMIVDLERNDLGRVCTTGSVRVETFAAVERLPTLHHLVSTVAGEIDADVGLAGLLAATFPGGSVTGAPKRRAMQVVAEIEPWPRGVYTGATGLIDPRGDLELGLPIRTGVVRDGRLAYHAGGGIVIDSTAERELDECWLKTAALRAVLGAEVPSLERCSSG